MIDDSDDEGYSEDAEHKEEEHGIDEKAEDKEDEKKDEVEKPTVTFNICSEKSGSNYS